MTTETITEVGTNPSDVAGCATPPPNGATVTQAVQSAAPIDVDLHRKARELEDRDKSLRALGQRISSRNRDLGRAETLVAEADAARKERMEARNKIQHDLDELHDELATLACGKSSERLFPPAGEDSEPARSRPDAATVEDPDAWRAVLISTLTPKIGTRAMKALRDHNPPLITHGELSAWQEKKGDFWATDIKGLGAKGREEIDNAQHAYFAANPGAGKITAVDRPAGDRAIDGITTESAMAAFGPGTTVSRDAKGNVTITTDNLTTGG